MQACAAGYVLTHVTTLKLQLSQLSGHRADLRQV
jgi:hypothetical protein